MTTNIIRKSPSGSEQFKQHSQAGPPSPTDDRTKGFLKFSEWIDETAGQSYVCIDDTPGAAVWVPAGIPGGGYNLVEEEGAPLPQRSTLNFVGAGVTASDVGGKTQIAIPGATTINPLTRVIFIDGGIGDDTTGDGSIARPYKTITKGLSTIPAATTPVLSRTNWVLVMSPGDYDEDLAIDGTNQHITLTGWGVWNLGQFNSPAANWGPTGTPRNITWSVNAAASTNQSIRSTLCIGTLLTPGSGQSTHVAYSTRPRISGKITVLDNVASGGTTKDLYLECEIFDAGATGASLDTTGGTAPAIGACNLWAWRARFRTPVVGYPTIAGANGLLVTFTESCAFDGLVSALRYSRISNSNVSAGLTVAAIGADVTPNGMVNSNFAGTLTGPSGCARMDANTNSSFVANGALLAGGATKVILEAPPLYLQFGAAEALAGAIAIFLGSTGDPSAGLAGNTELLAQRAYSAVVIGARHTAGAGGGSATYTLYVNGIATAAAVLVPCASSAYAEASFQLAGVKGDIIKVEVSVPAGNSINANLLSVVELTP